MNSMKAALATIVIAAAGCATTPDEPRTPVSSEAELAPLIGKRLMSDENYLTINADNTLEGNFGGERLAGTWTFEDGFWCRTLTEASDEVMQRPTDCQKLELSGTTLFGTRDRGTGNSLQYEIQ